MDFYQIGALKVFADLGALIEEDDMRKDAPASLCRLTPCTADEKKQIKFTDIPSDIMKIIKNHVINFKDNEEEYNFLSNFKKGQNKDLYKYFFDKESYYFVPEVVTQRSSIEPDTYKYEYKFYLDHVNVDNILQYVNKKYKKDYDKCKIIHKFSNGIQNKKGMAFNKNYISIGDDEMIINKNNKLQFSYGYKGFSKEYNIPENLETYLNNNVWKIKL
jgi:hypothetical protein